MKLFSIFGNPVSHSISPKMHNLALNGLDIEGCYIRTHLKDGSQLIEKFKSLQLDGANITVPHKEFAYNLCDELDEFAKQIGAVNTLVKKDDKIVGYNTDAPGFYKAIESFTGVNSVLILGAGGTAKAIATILKKNSLHVEILNRSKNRLDWFCKNGFKTYSWEEFKIKPFDLIINTTSAGLSDNSLPIDEKILNGLMKNAKYAFEVIYNKQTPFLKIAKQNSLTCKDGADMLLHQGVLAFNLFFNNKLDEKAITTHMKGAFYTK
jgi:shikimate dehydrogenase